ncbi:MAG: SOS response-associated peptidase family protein [Bacteroidota bacterium]
MVDRYTISAQSDALALVLGVEISEHYQAEYNAAPTKSLPVIIDADDQRLSFFNWGLMTLWTKNKSMSSKFYNKPLQSLVQSGSSAKDKYSRRCIIPMDGFYVWKTISKKQKIPFYFFFPDRRIFCVAGLWEESDGACSFLLVTRDADETVLPYQNDMPLILDLAGKKNWLENKDLNKLVESNSSRKNHPLTKHPVSPKIINIDLNYREMIEATNAADQNGNYTLFS